MKKLLWVLVAVLVCLAQLPAAQICPTVTGSGITDPSGCNVLITYSGSGAPVVSIVDTHPYEGIEDQLVGVVNNGSSTITSIPLSGPADLFGFDGDGICAGYIAASLCTTGDTTGYGPNGVTFSGINSNASSGIVNFSPGVGPGANGFFSLELAPGTGAPITVGGVPEPGTISTLAAGLLGLAFCGRKFVRKARS